MQDQKTGIRELFPEGRFRLPASEADIAAAEAALGVRLPEVLRQLYLSCDGFREDRGNAKYLLSLREEDTIGSLVSVTRFLWEQWPTADLKAFVFFGSSSGNDWWGIRWSGSEEVIAYHPSMGDEYEVVGSDILQVYQEDYALYDVVESKE